MTWRLLLLALMLFGAGLGLREPWPADEPRFALVARDMVRSGEWLIPHVAGEPYPDKPPVFMWAIATAYRLTGNLEVAFLLPSLLAALGTLWLVCDLAKRLWGERAAWHAGLLLLLTVQFTMQARTAQIDALLALWTTLAVYGLARHLLRGPRGGGSFTAWFAMGLGIITKGVGFLPALLLLPWALLRRRAPQALPRIEAPAWLWCAGPLFALGAVALWAVPALFEVSTSGSAELARYRDDILMRQTVERYAEPWTHIKPFWYYAVEVIPWAWLPLTLLLPWLVPAWWRRVKAHDAATWLLLGWALCVLAFFTLSPGKRGVYLLPALPAVVLAAAPSLEALLGRRGVQRTAVLAVVVLAVAALAAAAWILAADPAQRWGFDPTFVLVAAAALAIALAAAARWTGGVAALALAIFAGWQLYGWWAAPLMDASRSGRELMARVTGALPPDSELALAGWSEQLVLQLHRPLVHFGFRREAKAEARDAAAWLAHGPNRRLLIPEGHLPPCFDPRAGEPMGSRHRREWRLVGADALSGACPPGKPLRVRYYDPALGGLRGEELRGSAAEGHPPQQPVAPDEVVMERRGDVQRDQRDEQLRDDAVHGTRRDAGEGLG